jgi:rhodanese-related sulfurtransferase
MRQLTSDGLKSWLADGGRLAPLLLDVREPWEYQHCCIEGAQSMPMATVPTRLAELPKDREIVVICHHGGRSQQIAAFLEQAGFDRVHNLQGGVHAWALQVDPTMPRY